MVEICRFACRRESTEEESGVVLRRDPKLHDALKQSLRLGDMLLKNEERELAQANQLTDDLLKQEYRQPYLLPIFCHMLIPNGWQLQ